MGQLPSNLGTFHLGDTFSRYINQSQTKFVTGGHRDVELTPMIVEKEIDSSSSEIMIEV